MSTEDIRAALGEIAQEISGTNPDDVQLDKNFRDDLGVDSIEMMEIIYGAEDRFNISIPDDDAKTIATVADAVSMIEGRLAE